MFKCFFRSHFQPSASSPRSKIWFSTSQKELPLVAFLVQENLFFFTVGFSLQSGLGYFEPSKPSLVSIHTRHLEPNTPSPNDLQIKSKITLQKLCISGLTSYFCTRIETEITHLTDWKRVKDFTKIRSNICESSKISYLCRPKRGQVLIKLVLFV